MKKHLITTAALALAGLALLVPAASAGTLPFNTGDLILGFREFGVSTDYEVDIGSALDYIPGGTNAGSGLVTLSSISGIGADLTSIFGAGWTTDANLHWSISGATQAASIGSGAIPKNTLFATKGESVIGVSPTGWTAASSGTQAIPAGKINGAMGGTGVGGYANGDTASGQTLSTNNPVGLIQATSAANSYGSFQATDSGGNVTSSFGYFSGGIEGTFAGGTSGAVLDLYEMKTVNSGSAGTLIGSFELNNSGALSFNPGNPGGSAVPEPSTYAAILGVVTLGFVAVKRRRQAKA